MNWCKCWSVIVLVLGLGNLAIGVVDDSPVNAIVGIGLLLQDYLRLIDKQLNAKLDALLKDQ